ncbi:MAG TPA: hypothetical protein VJ044_18235 [Candidatus Hodarchaeales archaeon]|nr:hypothetical protein [Candidatus Hodarchaeales archaeon]
MTDKPEINIDEDTNDRDWIRSLSARKSQPISLEEALALLIQSKPNRNGNAPTTGKA